MRLKNILLNRSCRDAAETKTLRISTTAFSESSIQDSQNLRKIVRKSHLFRAAEGGQIFFFVNTSSDCWGRARWARSAQKNRIFEFQTCQKTNKNTEFLCSLVFFTLYGFTLVLPSHGWLRSQAARKNVKASA